RPHDSDLTCGERQVDVTSEMLTRHDDVTAAVGFAGHDRHFRHSGFGIRIEQFCAVSNDAVILLCRAWKKTRHIDKRCDRNIKAIKKPDEARGFDRSIDVKTYRKARLLIGYAYNRSSPHMC